MFHLLYLLELSKTFLVVLINSMLSSCSKRTLMSHTTYCKLKYVFHTSNKNLIRI